MAQVVECLPGKDEILSSNSSTGKKKKPQKNKNKNKNQTKNKRNIQNLRDFRS
jgi:hypothetical protein